MGKDSEELKPCPMCGDPLEIVHRNGRKYVRCITCIFETARRGDYVSDDELKRRCNRRPAEDALKAEIEQLTEELEELRYVVKKFGQWRGDDETGCPKSQHPYFPCTGEKDFKKKFGGDAYFDSIECDEGEKGCWVEYYRWKFQQKKMKGKDK